MQKQHLLVQQEAGQLQHADDLVDNIITSDNVAFPDYKVYLRVSCQQVLLIAECRLVRMVNGPNGSPLVDGCCAVRTERRIGLGQAV